MSACWALWDAMDAWVRFFTHRQGGCRYYRRCCYCLVVRRAYRISSRREERAFRDGRVHSLPAQQQQQQQDHSRSRPRVCAPIGIRARRNRSAGKNAGFDAMRRVTATVPRVLCRATARSKRGGFRAACRMQRGSQLPISAQGSLDGMICAGPMLHVLCKL
ncbi:hypothetical protein DENSPDRAFT_563879 [Dentipellis sp. KUC8613]|nr:hypothetical protein DENSPDRAFT_563879 [Dentipellis sp. KUC8613]